MTCQASKKNHAYVFTGDRTERFNTTIGHDPDLVHILITYFSKTQFNTILVPLSIFLVTKFWEVSLARFYMHFLSLQCKFHIHIIINHLHTFKKESGTKLRTEVKSVNSIKFLSMKWNLSNQNFSICCSIFSTKIYKNILSLSLTRSIHIEQVKDYTEHR
jgi:hypothetical protein